MSEGQLETYREKFVAHPQHMSTLRYWRVLWIRRFRGLSMAVCVLVCIALFDEKGSLFYLAALQFGVPVLCVWLYCFFKFVKARTNERGFEQVWVDDPEWALAKLGTYYTAQFVMKGDRNRERRCRGIKGLVLIALFLMCFAFFVSSRSIISVVVLALTGFVMLYQSIGFFVLNGELNRHDQNRKILRRSFAQLPTDISLVGGLSFLSRDEQAHGALSPIYDALEGKQEEKDGRE